jgi:hypothetical protein
MVGTSEDAQQNGSMAISLSGVLGSFPRVRTLGPT